MMKKLINKFRENLFLTNTIWNIGGKVIQMFISLIVGMLTARYLGPSNYGIIGYTASYVTFFSAICQLGFNSIAVKEILEQPDKQGEILGSTIFFRVLSSLLSSVGVVILVYFLDSADPLVMKVAFLQSLSLVFQSFEMIHFWYQSRMETEVSVKVQTFAYLIMAAYKIIILALGKDVTWFACSTAIEAAVVGAALIRSYRRSRGQRLKISFICGTEMLKYSYHFILSGMMVTIYSHMDKIMLEQMLNETAVGYYTAATKVAQMWSFVLTALINSARPLIISARKQSAEVYVKQNKRLYAAILWIGIAVAAVMTVGGKWIVQLMYGKEYLPATSSLQISAWYTMFAMLGTARGIWIVCENKAKYVKYYLGMGAVLNIILNYLLIPVYGPGGAAAATLITQIFTAVFAPALFKETRVYTRYVIQAVFFKGIK